MYINAQYNAHAVGSLNLDFSNIFEAIFSEGINEPLFSAEFHERFYASGGWIYNRYLIESSYLYFNGLDLSSLVKGFNQIYSLNSYYLSSGYFLSNNEHHYPIAFNANQESEAIRLASELNYYVKTNSSYSNIRLIDGINTELSDQYLDYINDFTYRVDGYYKRYEYTSDNFLYDSISGSKVGFIGSNKEDDTQNFIEALGRYAEYGYLLQEDLSPSFHEFTVYAGMRVQRVKDWVSGKAYRAGERVIYDINGLHEYEKTTNPFTGAGLGPPSASSEFYWKKVKSNVNSSDYISTGFSVRVLDDQPIFCKQDIIALSLSDQRLKRNVKNLDNCLAKIKKLREVSFEWSKDNSVNFGNDIGLIAQDVEEVFPQAFHMRDNGVKCINYKK